MLFIQVRHPFAQRVTAPLARPKLGQGCWRQIHELSKSIGGSTLFKAKCLQNKPAWYIQYQSKSGIFWKILRVRKYTPLFHKYTPLFHFFFTFIFSLFFHWCHVFLCVFTSVHMFSPLCFICFTCFMFFHPFCSIHDSWSFMYMLTHIPRACQYTCFQQQLFPQDIGSVERPSYNHLGKNCLISAPTTQDLLPYRYWHTSGMRASLQTSPKSFWIASVIWSMLNWLCGGTCSKIFFGCRQTLANDSFLRCHNPDLVWNCPVIWTFKMWLL